MGGVAVLHPQDCLKDGLFSTPVKSRRNPKPTFNYSNSSPNLTRSDGRKRSPPTGIRRNNRTTTAVVDPPPAVAKSLVMGQVKILKRGEPLDESSTVSTTTTTPPPREAAGDRKPSTSAGRRVLPPTKKKPERRNFSNPNPNPNPKIDNVLKNDDFALSSTDRLGPDPDMVPKKKNIFFAGSAFVDSPPPSSVPLPGFLTETFSAAVKDDPTSDLRRMLGLSLS